MRAILHHGGELRLTRNHPEPAAGDGDAIIRPTKVVLSAIDVEVCRGLGGHDGVVGHQFVGVVESATGPRSGELVGRRVVGAAEAVCGTCDMCRSGLRIHCRQKTVLGQHGRDGCLAERCALPMDNLIVLPDDVDDDHAVFAASLAAGMQAVRQLTIKGKPYVTVLGDGLLGLLTVQLMAGMNMSVRMIGRHSSKLALCEKWGIKHRHADDVGRRADQDVVVDCTGTPDGLALAFQLVRPRGTVLVKSLYAIGGRAAGADLAPLVSKEISLLGSGSGPLAEAVGVIQRQEVDVLSLRGRRMKLDDGPAILHAAAEVGSLAVVVDI